MMKAPPLAKHKPQKGTESTVQATLFNVWHLRPGDDLYEPAVRRDKPTDLPPKPQNQEVEG